MRKLLFVLLLPLSLLAQPTKEEIRKNHILKATEKRIIGDDTQSQSWWYDVNGYDSLQSFGQEMETIRNVFSNGKLSQVTHYTADGKATDIYDYEYKPDGSYKETYTDPYYKMKSYQWYNAKGAVTKSQSPDGNITAYTYDGRGKLLSVISNGKNDGLKINNKFFYNTKGQLTKQVKNTNGNLVTITYEYDAKGNSVRELEKGSWEGEKYESDARLEYNDRGLVSKKTSKNKTASSPNTATIIYEFTYEYY